MATKWNRMRLSAGAVALAVALAAGAPANAAIYKFTFSDQGTVLGSALVDSNPYFSSGDGSTYFGAGFNAVNGSGAGYFNTNFSQYHDGSGNGFYHSFYYTSRYFNIGTSSYDPLNQNAFDYNAAYGEIDDLAFANFDLASGTFNGFKLGTYSLSNIGGYSSSPQSFTATTLTIGPAAPAPLAGGGILAGLISLLGFGFSRFGRRRQALA
jgi:hypothetical protein